MNVSSRLAGWRIFAIALVIILGCGTPALQAKHHEAEGCQAHGQVTSQECAAPMVRQKPLPQPTCCVGPVVREKPTPAPADTCCPVDPKDVKKAQKAAEHAQHE